MKHLGSDLAMEFSVYKRIMWLVGAWPISNKQCIFNIRWIFGMIVEFSVGVLAILEVMKPTSEYASHIDTLYTLNICILSLLKSILFGLRSSDLQENLKKASHDWSHPKDNESYMLMKKRAKFSKTVTAAFIISGFVCFASFLITNVIFPWTPSKISDKLIRSYMLPFGPLEDISHWEHRWWLLLQFFLSCMVHLRQCVIDSFFFCATMHLCGQFDILKLEFYNFSKKSLTKTEFKVELGALVRRHWELIDLVQNIEHTFHRIILVQVASTIFLMGENGLQIMVALKRTEFYEAAECVPFFITLTLQIGIYAHAGQTLLDENRNILETIYDIDWEGLPSSRTKDFIIIMMKSNVPCSITGGKFFYICYSALSGIIKRVFTYVTFLQISYDDDRPNKRIQPIVEV